MFPFASSPSTLYGGSMPQAPHPAGWKGGSEDFGFLRTFDGHIGSNPYKGDDEGSDADEDARRNVRWGTAAADIANYGDA